MSLSGVSKLPHPSDPFEDDPLQFLDISPADRILLYLALGTMKTGGHRYGAFLDAATTAAKFAIYSTYMEQGENIRKTGFLYHVEPKRVKAIVKEVRTALEKGQNLKALNTQEPYYLIALPHLWQEYYPCSPDSSPIDVPGLTPGERQAIVDSLPKDLPAAKILDLVEFTELIKRLHELTQVELPEHQQVSLSEALTEHIKFRLLYSGTVLQVEATAVSIPLFALARTTYSPKGQRERVFTMLNDVSRIFHLLQAWVKEHPGYLRAIEVFDVDPNRREEALQELDQMLQSWADKYHQEGGHPMVLQVAAGTRDFDVPVD